MLAANVVQQSDCSLQLLGSISAGMPSNMFAAGRVENVIGHITMNCALGLSWGVKNSYWTNNDSRSELCIWPHWACQN